MQDIKIKKAKIKDDIFLEVEYTEFIPGHNKKDIKMTSSVPVHDDLKNAFQKLESHLAVLCDGVKHKQTDDIEIINCPEFFVKGIAIGGNDESEGVTVSGYKEGVYGTINLNTPFVKFSGDVYPFASELADSVNACIVEVDEYLFNGKRAPGQPELPFPESEQPTEE